MLADVTTVSRCTEPQSRREYILCLLPGLSNTQSNIQVGREEEFFPMCYLHSLADVPVQYVVGSLLWPVKGSVFAVKDPEKVRY
jgi:hypothetical protein